MMAEKTLIENVQRIKRALENIKFNIDNASDYYGDGKRVGALDGQPIEEYGHMIGMVADDIATIQHEEGSIEGKQSVIDNSQKIAKTANGKGIFLNDVSDVYHDVTVRADTLTEVEVYGKNLFNDDTSLCKEIFYTSKNGSRSSRIGYEPLVLPAGTYTFTLNHIDTNVQPFVYGVINDKDDNFVGSCNLLLQTTNCTPLTITVNEGDKIYIYNGNSNMNLSDRVAELSAVQIQLEWGKFGTDIEPFHKTTVVATPDGTKIPSDCPNMSFIADSEITVDYYGSYAKDLAYNEFWDRYQDKGNRTEYSYGFAGEGWNDDNAIPKYSLDDIYISNGYMMFSKSKIKNVAKMFPRLYVRQAQYLCYNAAQTEHIGEVIVNDHGYGLFSGCTALVTVDKINILQNTYVNETTLTSTFQNCINLENIIFDGEIKASINMQWSTKLTVESAISLLTHLQDRNMAFDRTVTLPEEVWARVNASEEMREIIANEPTGSITCAQDLAWFKGWNYA